MGRSPDPATPPPRPAGTGFAAALQEAEAPAPKPDPISAPASREAPRDAAPQPPADQPEAGAQRPAAQEPGPQEPGTLPAGPSAEQVAVEQQPIQQASSDQQPADQQPGAGHPVELPSETQADGIAGDPPMPELAEALIAEAPPVPEGAPEGVPAPIAPEEASRAETSLIDAILDASTGAATADAAPIAPGPAPQATLIQVAPGQNAPSQAVPAQVTHAQASAGMPEPPGSPEAVLQAADPAHPEPTAPRFSDASAREDVPLPPITTTAAEAPPQASADATPQAPAPSAAPPPPLEAPAAALRGYAQPPVVPAQQVAPIILAQAARGGDPSRLIVQLRPAELGGVEVAVEGRRDGGTQVSILVERPETLILLQRDRGAIEQALNAAGIETNSETLRLNLGDPGRGDTQGGEHRAERGRHGNPQPWGAQGSATAETIATAPPRLRARGLLDLAL